MSDRTKISSPDGQIPGADKQTIEERIDEKFKSVKGSLAMARRKSPSHANEFIQRYITDKVALVGEFATGFSDQASYIALKIDHLYQEILKETELQLRNKFQVYFYDPADHLTRTSRLTGPGQYRVKPNADIGILQTYGRQAFEEFYLKDFQETGNATPDTCNKYSLSLPNLQYLMPVMTELVDKLLRDIEAAKSE